MSSKQKIEFKNFSWINIANPSKKDIDQLGQEYKFHPLDLADCLSLSHRSKVDVYPKYAFIVLLFLGYRKEWKYFLCAASFFGFLTFLLIVLPWYTAMTRKFGPAFIQEFYYNDHLRRLVEAEHISNDTWYFYPMSMIGCTFPWSLFVGASLFYLPKYLKRKEDPFLVFLSSCVVAIFISFQFAHSKLTSYIFPLFPTRFMCKFSFSTKTGPGEVILIRTVVISITGEKMIRRKIEPTISMVLFITS